MDVILDPVGGDYLEANLRSLAAGGRLIVIGLMGGRRGEIDLGRLLVKRLRVVGSVLRGRTDAEKTRIVEGLHDRVWPHVVAGRIRPVIDRILPITDAEQAHAAIAANETLGKVILTIP
jgi:NADPH:quinone reductase-like Zn-dependent oxidoreductase